MTRSHDLFQAACIHIPGGVNSPVRAFKGVGGDPVFFTRGEGACLYDADDKRYIDYVGSWGPMIAGHAHPEVIQAVQAMAANGLGFGAPTEIETRMADTLCTLHQASLMADRKSILKIAEAIAKIKDNVDELLKPKRSGRRKRK